MENFYFGMEKSEISLEYSELNLQNWYIHIFNLKPKDTDRRLPLVFYCPWGDKIVLYIFDSISPAFNGRYFFKNGCVNLRKRCCSMWNSNLPYPRDHHAIVIHAPICFWPQHLLQNMKPDKSINNGMLCTRQLGDSSNLMQCKYFLPRDDSIVHCFRADRSLL